MGISISAKILVGIPAENVLTTKYETTEVKKYNQDTGEPFFVKQHKPLYYIFDKSISTNDPWFVEGFLKTYTNGTLDYISINEDYYVGKLFSYVGTCDESLVKNRNFSTLKEIYDQVTESLRYRGYTDEVYIINALEHS